jgi:chromosome partitioning protein
MGREADMSGGCTVIAIANQKGGTGKTTTTANLGIALATLHGKRVLLIDADAQGDLTTALGWPEHDELDVTLATHLERVIRDEDGEMSEGILRHAEGIDLMPGSIELSGIEMGLVNAMSREYTLRSWLDCVKDGYDYVLIDCMPSLGMTTINALTAADQVIIPVQAHYLPAKGMTQLVKTISRIKRQINPNLKVGGVLLTLVDGRTNLARQSADSIRNTYGSAMRIFKSSIPVAVKAAETSAYGKSIFAHDRQSPVAAAYAELAKEVASYGERKRDSLQAAQCR